MGRGQTVIIIVVFDYCLGKQTLQCGPRGEDRVERPTRKGYERSCMCILNGKET